VVTPRALTASRVTRTSGADARLAHVGSALRGAGAPQLLAYLIGPFALVVLWLMRDAGWIVDRPMWVYVAIVAGPAAASGLTNALYAKYRSTAAIHARTATDAIATTLVIYATGWGPALGLTYLVGAQQLAAIGTETWKTSRRWALAGIACGQLAIAFGITPSFIRSPIDNGVAALGAVTFVMVSQMARSISADRERAWERLRSLLNNSSDLIVVRDVTGALTYASGACERLTGLTVEELQRVTLADLVHPDDLPRANAVMFAAMATTESSAPFELRARHRDGNWRWLEIVGTNLLSNPAVAGVVLNVRDITDRKSAEAELAHNAVHDALTGLPNRSLLLDRLTSSLARCRRGGVRPSVLFVDLDRFKLINDSLGHDVGDDVLVEVAQRLRGAVRVCDTVSRFGGDEFVVLCEPPGDPEELARRLLDSLEQPFRIGGEDYYLSASIGVTVPDDAAAQAADVIRDADTAMYRAKELGRGRLQRFDEPARTAAVTRAHTEHLLRGAAERGELRLFYQPIVDLRSTQIVGTEALLRWQHPQQGLIGPDGFMPTAEDSGLIVPIGEWVLDEAFRQASVWAHGGATVDMAINVSARQLADDHLTAVLSQAIERHRGPQHAALPITLEVTESALISDPEAVQDLLVRLQRLGAKLSMDDFGTGYSSLTNLRGLPFDSLKIDRSFVAGLGHSHEDTSIVRAIVSLAHTLGQQVIAEGVETELQLNLLRDIGCDLAQGYYIGRPQPATALPSELVVGGTASDDEGDSAWLAMTGSAG
jgi:diguanylate cyclase (GGDEF)-like protein/PAS domain S-box-containing protein